MIAKTFYGFENVLAKELLALGAMDVTEGNRMVSFTGDKGFMYKANLSLRTALKILKPYKSFKVNSEQELYDKVYNLPWEDHLDIGSTFAIDPTVHSEIFTHSKYAALKVKDAIVDRFRDRTGERPSVDLDFPSLRINLHIEKNFCNLNFDTSGDSLHKRGYRGATNIAPINEVLAAGMLMLSGWDGQCDFLDPMCGSGTIPIEAAMIACNIPPNINRKEFAFEKWKDWDEDLYEKIEDSVLNKIRDFRHSIVGYDKAPSAVLKAKENVKLANLQEFVRIEQQDFFETEKEVDGHLHMVFNPPYGERLEIDVEQFYGKIGDTLKTNYKGTNAWFIASNFEGIKSVGLRASKKIKLYNGALEARLLKYEIYEGSRKRKNN